MIKFKDECRDCAVPAYPCISDHCPYMRVPHHYCDNCGREIFDYKYMHEGEELCKACFVEEMERDGIQVTAEVQES